MRQNSRRSFLALLSALFVAPLFTVNAQGLIAFDRSALLIKTANGRFKFNIEMAISRRQQSQGLMFRHSLAADAGMLFDYRIPQRISMWMKNTFIPLDMIFIDQDGKVINIAERAIPHSEVVISSKTPARAVLEVNGGTASRLGIRSGDQVLHAIFK
ncbi:MAG: DUF192 domain-containing protein [Rhodospirillales bacterium]|jgi:hypothetical protein|nr:DUF192 domain-containing protein [Rhodospirillales bacterium]MDP7425752.1 DUF192 domain-containing protein [Rhodospirillales bacterium]